MRKPPCSNHGSDRPLAFLQVVCIIGAIVLMIVAIVLSVGCKTKTESALETSQKENKRLKEEPDQHRKRHEAKAASCCDSRKATKKGEKKGVEQTKLALLQPDEEEPEAETKSAPIGTRVVIVSVDGFHTGLVPDMWRFKKLQENGSWTLMAQTTSPSITTVAHASMFTGMDPGTHGVKGKAPKGGVKLAHWHPLKVKTIFQMVDKETFRPASLVQKKKLENLFPISAAGLARLDRSLSESSIVDTACSEIRDPEGSRLIFIHLKRLDHIGHTKGWMTTAQKNAAKRIDEALGNLSGCIGEGQIGETAPPITLIVTADHGGHKKTHGSKRASDMNIPWLIIGPGVKAGHEIAGKVHVKDTAPTALYFLGIDRSDKGFEGKMPEEILE